MNSIVQNLLIILTLVSIESSHLVIFLTSGLLRFVNFASKFDVSGQRPLLPPTFPFAINIQISSKLSEHLQQLKGGMIVNGYFDNIDLKVSSQSRKFQLQQIFYGWHFSWVVNLTCGHVTFT